MAYLDAETLFSEKQDMTNGPSTNTIEVPPPLHIGNAGTGRPLYLMVMTHGAATGSLTVTVNTSDSPDMTDAFAMSAHTIMEKQVMRGGPVLTVSIPSTCRRYLRLEYAGATGGEITAGLVLAGQTNL